MKGSDIAKWMLPYLKEAVATKTRMVRAFATHFPRE